MYEISSNFVIIPSGCDEECSSKMVGSSQEIPLG
jgi:hypothetical protein